MTSAVGVLSGVKVIVTRAAEQAGGFIRMLESAGAEVVEFPTIMTVPPEDYGPLDGAIGRLGGFDYVIFTSVNAFLFFTNRLGELGGKAGDLKGLGIIAVGPKTAAALEASGLKPDIVPEEFKAEGILAALEGRDIKGKRFLYPRAEGAREVIAERLREKGATVEAPVAYRTVAPEIDRTKLKETLGGAARTVITFTSSSTVRNFMEAAGEDIKGYLDRITVACIGPVTAKTCEEAGLPVRVVPADYTVDALFLALTDYFKKEKW
ncbi:MAG: uroporphyrinogen-III synthase [Nitrospirota bacterium]